MHLERPRRLVALLLICGSALVAQESRSADEPPTSQPTSRRTLDEAERIEVEKLIVALSSESFAEREKANEVLGAFGPVIRPLLEAAQAIATAEARIRITQLLEALGEEEESLVAPNPAARVTLDVSEKPLHEVLALFARQTGVKFPDTPGVDTSGSVTLAFENLPFFEALDRLAAAARMNWQQDYIPGSFRFQSGVQPTPIRLYSGPFRIALTRVTHNANLTFGGEVFEQGFLQGQLDVDPVSDVAGVWMPPEITTFVDDKGRNLLPESAANTGAFNAAQGRKTYYFSINFTTPEKDAKMIGRLAGRFRLAVPKRTQRLALEHRPGNLPFEAVANDTKARLTSVQAQGTQLVVMLELERRPVYADDRVRQPVTEQRIEIIRQNGEIIRPLAPPSRSSTPEKEMFTAVFTEVSVDEVESVVIHAVTELTHRFVDFEFKDLPLP